MTNPAEFDQSGPRILGLIREGMKVYDRENHEIGSVKAVHMGAASETMFDEGEGPATAPNPSLRGESWLDAGVQVFAPEQVPDVLKARLLRHGFIAIDTKGLFSSDRFAMPEQITNVVGDGVHLNVTENELIKKTIDAS